ncbi:unnamed protein product [Microthlaspi erraticum]|uniref:F-box domain-containing protein n=1 Tax=Microthlaspi erraticum TaxID=1685480 RepID=A0A6D2KMJ8_9BRAS|nr:unnamed protein product [Microthlaspi erraticum]
MKCTRHESGLPHDVVELILERLPVKSLRSFKSVSKQWRSTIDSQSFKERQSLRRRLSRGPDVLFVRLTGRPLVGGDDSQRFTFGSSTAYTVTLPKTASTICNSICDGLVCLYDVYVAHTPNLLVNPATGWHQSFPLSTIQRFFIDITEKRQFAGTAHPELGFGKDKLTGTYKAVWLYNSADYRLDNVTTCEVYDFSTRVWRYVVPASPCRILSLQFPVYLDGSLYWLTTEGEVLSFDLHAETFQVISKAPLPHAPDGFTATMCVLDDRLCVSQKHGTTQFIWSLDDSSPGAWKELCSVDLTKAFSCKKFDQRFVLPPVAILDKNKVLLRGRDTDYPVVIYDLDTKSCDILFIPANLLDDFRVWLDSSRLVSIRFGRRWFLSADLQSDIENRIPIPLRIKAAPKEDKRIGSILVDHDCMPRSDLGALAWQVKHIYSSSSHASCIFITICRFISSVSLVDKFNLPVSMRPVGCGVAACEVDLNVCCPSALEVMRDGKVVGCKSACLAMQPEKECCTGEYANPKAYSYASDGSSSLKKCRASRYVITFCPPK